MTLTAFVALTLFRQQGQRYFRLWLFVLLPVIVKPVLLPV